MTGNGVTRRGLLTGLGAAGGAALIGTAPADAAPATPASGSSGAGDRRPAGTPVGLPTPLSSAPQTGVKYYFRDFEEFLPEAFSGGRAWGGQGAYTPSGSTTLSTSFDLPPGARVHDVEWYVFNSSGAPVTLLVRVFSAGSGQYLSSVVDGSAPSTGNTAAVRLVPPAGTNGPFPHGTRLVTACFGSTSSNFQVNGVRLGLENAPLSTVLLPSPVRVVDSRASGGPLRNSGTRSISLASQVPVGALGAVVNLTALHTVGVGYLTAYATGSSKPGTSSLSWFASRQTVANQVTCALTTSRAISLFCRSQTDVIVDLVGYLV